MQKTRNKSRFTDAQLLFSPHKKWRMCTAATSTQFKAGTQKVGTIAAKEKTWLQM